MRTYTVCAALALTAFASAVAAQAPAPAAGTGQRLTFEVASIKRNVSGDANSSVRGQPGGRLVVTNNSLYNLIRNAYNTQRFEMVPGAKLLRGSTRTGGTSTPRGPRRRRSRR